MLVELELSGIGLPGPLVERAFQAGASGLVDIVACINGDELRFYEQRIDNLELFVEYARILAAESDIDDIIKEVQRAP
jgi:hypothetical protein